MKKFREKLFLWLFYFVAIGGGLLLLYLINLFTGATVPPDGDWNSPIENR
jgi:hypothetical protein